MSKKNLLNESQVRQFMKLASLTPLTPGFVRGLTETSTKELDETHGRGTGIGEADRGIDNTSPGRRVRTMENNGMEDPEAVNLEDPEGDMEVVDDLEVDVPADLGDADGAEPLETDAGDQMVSVGDLVSAIKAALEDITGEPVEASIDGADLDAPSDEIDGDLEADVADIDAVDDMEAEDEMPMDDEMLEETDASKVDDDEKNESTEATDELVEQITKRVAARILKSALAKK